MIFINDELLLTYSGAVPCGVFASICRGNCHNYYSRWAFFCTEHPLTLFFTASVLPSSHQSYPNPDPGQTICIPLQGNILCLLSGVVLLLIGSYWPIAYCWKIRQSRNFTMLGCYSCVLSVLIVSCLVALMATMAFSATMFQCFDLFSLGGIIAMGVVIFIFLCSSVCCLCCCSNKIGRIC